MSDAIEFRVRKSEGGGYGVSSPTPNGGPGWSLMTHVETPAQIGEVIAEELAYRRETDKTPFLHFMTGSSTVQCGAPMRQPGSIVGWDLGTCTTNADKVTCPDCLGAWGR